MSFSLWLPGMNFGAYLLSLSVMWSSLSVLAINFHISKELQSSARVHFCSKLMVSCSCTHMSWWLLLILFNWTSVQMLPLLSLQDALTPLWYSCEKFRWTPHLCLNTWYSLQRLHPNWIQPCSPLMSQSLMEAWSPVLCAPPAADPSSGSVMALVGLEEGLAGSHPHCSALGPASSTNSGT